MYDVVTIGGATRDIFLISDQYQVEGDVLKLTWGEKLVAQQIMLDIGGGACNGAVGLSRLGLKTAFWSKVGNDAGGEEIAKRLKREGVSLQFLEIDEETQTSISCLLTSSTGEHTIVMYRGKNDDLLKSSPLWSELEKTKWLYLTDVASTSEELTLKVTEVAESKKINLAFVPGQHQIKLGKDFFRSVLKTCEIFILNRHEAETILGTGREIGEMLPEFIKMGTKIVVITDDKNGVQASDGRQVYQQKAPAVEKLIDTTGAGDAFAVGFVAARVLGKPIKEALSWGNKNAGSVISQFGAQTGLLAINAIDSHG